MTPKVWSTTSAKRRWKLSVNSAQSGVSAKHAAASGQPFLRDRFLHLLLLIGVALSLAVPFRPALWPAAIDWHTIITLTGLMMLTKGVELSGYFDVLGRKMVARFRQRAAAGAVHGCGGGGSVDFPD
ncbi:Inner membrane protein YbiR [Cedecea neteri]|uniref:Inner membrane protein YbiR n=1 Tax=Cedecea neteri TaxID=158822 RepID=A0A2X2SWR8_9ENTR|nr:Inner membrane protein YbiR [Cedecea neteri]